MRKVKVNNSGHEMEAVFYETTIADVWIPFLRNMTQLQKALNRRIVVFLAAPCGCGKTTLSLFLEQLSKEVEGVTPLQAIGIDGFHYRQEYLLSHTIIRGQEEVVMTEVKGCPETFDFKKAKSKIEQLQEEEVVMWPVYDRVLHNPIEDQKKVDAKIVLLEGNYLLLDEEGWKDLRKESDYTIFIEAKLEQLKQRLVDRKRRSGNSLEASVHFVETSDLRNAKRVLQHRLPADLNLCLVDAFDYRRVHLNQSQKDFYHTLANYYDIVFPKEEKKVQFLKKELGHCDKVLDIACGNGMYTEIFANATGIDLDEKMIAYAKKKGTKMYQVGSMETIEERYDGMFCIGNSLVHLSSIEKIGEVLAHWWKQCEENGTLVIQIVNYDRVLDEGVTMLPLIEQEGVQFYREYEVEGEFVYFKTRLKTKEGWFYHQVKLCALRYEVFMKLLRKAGFHSLQAYGNFAYAPFDKKHSPALIVVAKK